MDSDIADGFQFDKGENGEKVIARFVELSALHYDNKLFTPFVIALEVFNEAKLRDPATRSASAANDWIQSLKIQEAIREAYQQRKFGNVDASEAAIIARAIKVFEHPKTDAKEQLAALRLLADIKGYIRKQVEVKDTTIQSGDLFSKEIADAVAGKV